MEIIKDYIEKMRAEPKDKRHKFAIVVSFCVTSVIFAAWVIVFSSSINTFFGSSGGTVADDADKSNMASVIDGFKSLKASVGQLFGSKTSDDGGNADAGTNKVFEVTPENFNKK